TPVIGIRSGSYTILMDATSHARAHGGTVADRLLHSKCNSDRQDGSRDHERPAVTGEPFAPAVEDDRARWCLLDW
ncbi:hypothetical protein ACFFRM_29280, partial [Rhodococcus aetherivorans]